MLKKIAAITMARNDTFFLNRWAEYYGREFGEENIYILLDGMDQDFKFGKANVEKLPHPELGRAAGDKYRIKKLNELARTLFSRGYGIVIGCDSDEFLVINPGTGKSLRKYLSDAKIRTSLSGIGMDVGQNLKLEKTLDPSKPFLEQRGFAQLSTRYTKAVVLARPLKWGSGFHRIRGHNYHIDPNLYLFHFGSVDMNMLKTKAIARGADWLNHLERRGNGTINSVSQKYAHGEHTIKMARIMQTIFRPVYAYNKPAMFGWKPVVKIPKRFIKTRL